MEVRPRQKRPFGIDVALAIGNHHHACRLAKQRFGSLSRVEPAAQFLLREQALPMRDGHPPRARPHPSRYQAQTGSVSGINRQHHMGQRPAADPLADLARTTQAGSSGCKIELAGVLDRQNMTTRYRCRRPITPALDQPIHRHLAIGDEPTKPNVVRSPLTKAPKAHSLRATMRPSSAGPLYRGGDPRTGPMTNSCPSPSLTLPQSEVSDTKSHHTTR